MTRQPRERSAGSVAVALAAALLFATPSAGAGTTRTNPQSAR